MLLLQGLASLVSVCCRYTVAYVWLVDLKLSVFRTTYRCLLSIVLVPYFTFMFLKVFRWMLEVGFCQGWAVHHTIYRIVYVLSQECPEDIFSSNNYFRERQRVLFCLIACLYLRILLWPLSIRFGFITVFLLIIKIVAKKKIASFLVNKP